MKKIVITQSYEINLPKEYENETKEELLNNLNAMYDCVGQEIIHRLDARGDYIYTMLTEIDDEEVYMDGNEVGNQGSLIILDGQPLDEEEI